MKLNYLFNRNLTRRLSFSGFDCFYQCTRYATEAAEQRTQMLSLTNKWTAQLDEDVKDKLQSKKMSARKHPGVTDVKCVRLPDRLNLEIANVLKDYSIQDLKHNSQNLINYLKSRKLPVENDAIDDYSRDIFHQINEQRGDVDSFPLEEQEIEAKKRKELALSLLRAKLYHWKPIEFNTYKGMLYLIARLAPNYASLYRVFSEIHKFYPDFNPTTLFDFGSGLGTVSWAANSFWSKSLREYFNVDISSEMNDIARLLLQGKGVESELKGVFYRQYLPPSHAVKFNLVVSAYSLLELPSTKTRLQTIDSLWKKTENFLVVIEDGTNAGYEAVLEARDFILELHKDDQSAHVVAPCPHHHQCPRFFDGSRTPCNFEVTYQPLELTKNLEAVTHRFSYVVLSKTTKSKSWPRIVRPVLCRGKHVICRLCTNDGKLKEIIVTKSKNGKEMYNCARSSQWGDLLPITDLKLLSSQDVQLDENNEKN